ncbi:MAG TPA: hypothetical protein VF482_03265 [Trebonia sp.]
MNQPNDDLLTALRAARPDPGYQPSPASPEAAAMMTRILGAHPERDRVSRPIRRRLVLAGIPAVAGAAAAGSVLATRAGAPSPASPVPAASSVRTAVLDALGRSNGDIHAMITTAREADRPVWTVRSWIYPAFPQPGQRVRVRQARARNGVSELDTAAIYIQPGTAGHGTAGGQVLTVNFADRTWSLGQDLIAAIPSPGAFSPAAIRKQIADREFTVAGTDRIAGRQAIRLKCSALGGRPGTILWVDAETYLALRAFSKSANGTFTIEYQILPVTSANLKLLTPPIPAGFTRTAPIEPPPSRITPPPQAAPKTS